MARHTDQRVVQEVPAPENTDRILCTDCLAHITHLHGRHVPLSVLELQAGRFGGLLSRISTKRNGQRFRRIRHPENPLHPAAFGTGHMDSVPDYTAYASFRQKKLLGSLGLILTGGIIFLIIRGGVTESTSNIGQVYYCNDEFLNHSAVNPAFSLLASVSKTKDYAEQFNYFGKAERDSLFNGLYPVKGENTAELLKTKRPNILIILMEGFGGAMVESLGGVKGRQSEHRPACQGRNLVFPMLRKQFPDRQRHYLYVQRIPKLPGSVCHENTGKKPHASFHCRKVGEGRLPHGFFCMEATSTLPT